MSHYLLRENIRGNLELSDEQLDEICSCFSLRAVDKGEYLLRQGNMCTFEGFVTDGCFRVFTLDKKGNENILYFAARDWWLIDTDSFMNHTPSDLNFQALESSEVLIISKAEKERLYDQLPYVEKLFAS